MKIVLLFYTKNMSGYSKFTVTASQTRDGNLHAFYRRLYSNLPCTAVDEVHIQSTSEDVDTEILAFRLGFVPLTVDAPVETPITVTFRGKGIITSGEVPYAAISFIPVIILGEKQSVTVTLIARRKAAEAHAKYMKYIYVPNNTQGTEATIEYVTNSYNRDDFLKEL